MRCFNALQEYFKSTVIIAQEQSECLVVVFKEGCGKKITCNECAE